MIFFDLDATLIDDERAVRTAVAAFHAEFRDLVTDPLDAFQVRWRAALERWFDRYLAGELTMQEQRRRRIQEIFPALSDAEADERFERYLAAYVAATSTEVALFPDVLPALDALRDVPLGIISNGQDEQQRGKLGATGILPRFSVVVVSSEAGAAKPSPDIFATACRRGGVSPSECIHVGDRLTHDALAASAAGLRGVWLARDMAVPPDPRVPTLRSLVELARLVRVGGGAGRHVRGDGSRRG